MTAKYFNQGEVDILVQSLKEVSMLACKNKKLSTKLLIAVASLLSQGDS